ncbi:MAG: ABC-F family ATP-binding cassette domain-containing protein [Chitinophagales bacterium]
MINVKNLTKEYNGTTVLDELSFYIGARDKVAIVGANGVGKSTLLRILAGVALPDGGKVEYDGDKPSIGFLLQELTAIEDVTIRDYVRKETGIESIAAQMQLLEYELEDPKKLEAYGDLQSLFLRLDGYAFENNMKKTLDGLGLTNIALDRALSTLSGGQKSKVQLTAILLKGVDVIILDEPTNNLDLPALIWLEQFIQETSATCVMVSHDRAFLDSVVTKVFEIDWEKRSIIKHNTGYTEYLDFKAKELFRLKELYQQQQEEIGELKESINLKKNAVNRSGGKAKDNDKLIRNFKAENSSNQSAKQARQLEKRIEQMDKVEKPKERALIKIEIDASLAMRKHEINFDKVAYQYPDGFGLTDVNLSLPFGKKIGIYGANGSGKSTLLKLISGVLQPNSGAINIGHTIVMGNLMQAHEDLPHELSLLEFLKSKNTHFEKSEVYHLLHLFGFEVDEYEKSISKLSPGGRARLIMASFSLEKVNTLILDEPTNHMDVEAIDALIELLNNFSGMVILVSHDRNFIKSVHPEINYLVEGGRLRHINSYTDMF